MMVFHWSLSDSKSPQVFRTRLRILAVLSNAVIWIVSTRLPTSKSSRPFNNPIVIVPKAPITIGTIVTFMFHCFFDSLARSRYLSFFSHSFRFILWLAGTAKSTILQILFFLLIIIRSGLLAGIRWSVCTLKSHRSLCVSFSWTGAGLCIYHLLVWSNLDFLHISQWINHNWYNSHFHVPQLFQFSCKVEVPILLFTFLQIYSGVRRDSKVDMEKYLKLYHIKLFYNKLYGIITWSYYCYLFIIILGHLKSYNYLKRT